MDKPARSPLARSFERHMRAENRSERTIATYLFGLRQAETFLRERPDQGRCADERERAALRPTTLEAATRADLEAFMADVLARGRAPSTAATYYKVLKVMYAWLVEEQEIQVDPMGRMKPPLVPAKPVPIVPADGLKRLFAACAGASFEARRDTALVMLLLDTGARREEMAGLTLADVDLDLDVLLVLGKGRRERTLPFGRKSGEALDRYLRVRARHKDAELPWLWLGKKGQLTAWGLVQMLRRRGAQAGLPGLHPHQLRHTFAHEWLVQGGAHRVGRVGGPLGDRGHRAGAGQHRGGRQPQDAGQRVAAAGRAARIGDGGQVGEQVRGFGGAERVGYAQRGQARRGSGMMGRQARASTRIMRQ